MIARILSWLFPPRMPSPLRDWPESTPYRTLTDEEGWAGNVRRQFTGIEKHWMMDWDTKIYRVDREQYHKQLRNAETMIAAFEAQMTAEGYVNTIHDCWEKEENS